ncbi:MAG TPA: hypothetical protein PJ982_08185 [Lacipirellulaceae bacterium]|nr:hypothetical protein [Lacipirellulaceae bacterium]
MLSIVLERAPLDVQLAVIGQDAQLLASGHILAQRDLQPLQVIQAIGRALSAALAHHGGEYGQRLQQSTRLANVCGLLR